MCVFVTSLKGTRGIDVGILRTLDLHDEIGTKGNNKHAKREAKSRSKHKYYWIHK